MSYVNGIATLIALLTFIGIIWWAFSRGRSKANRDASLLPFALPDEGEELDANKTDPNSTDKNKGTSDE